MSTRNPRRDDASGPRPRLSDTTLLAQLRAHGATYTRRDLARLRERPSRPRPVDGGVASVLGHLSAEEGHRALRVEWLLRMGGIERDLLAVVGDLRLAPRLEPSERSGDIEGPEARPRRVGWHPLTTLLVYTLSFCAGVLGRQILASQATAPPREPAPRAVPTAPLPEAPIRFHDPDPGARG